MLSVASRTTLHSILTCKILSQEHQYNIEQDFSCAMLSGASRTTLHKVSPLQYCSRSIKTTLYRIFSWAALPKYVWDNSAQENYLWNVGPERTVIFSQEDNLHNVVLTCLGQYCKDPQSTNNFTQANNLQFCLDLSEPTLHKEVTCAMLVHGWQCLWGKYPIQCCLCRSCWDNIASEYYLFNVFQICLRQKLPVQCGPRAHRHIFAEKPVVVSNVW